MIGFAQRSQRKKYAEAQRGTSCGKAAVITQRLHRDLGIESGFAASAPFSAPSAVLCVSARNLSEATA